MKKIEGVRNLEELIPALRSGYLNHVAICDRDGYLIAHIHYDRIEQLSIAPFAILNIARHARDGILWDKSEEVDPDMACRPKYLKILLDTEFKRSDIPLDLHANERRCTYASYRADAPVQL